MITEPGPRDWLPPTPSRPSRPKTLLADSCPPRRSGIGAAALSLLFGISAIVFATAPFIPNATGGRFVVGTVGLTAIYAGVRSFHQRRGRASIGASVLSAAGIGAGTIGTLVMLATWASFQGAPGLLAQAQPQHSALAQAAEPPVPAPQPRAVRPSVGTMEQAVGTLASVMKKAHVAGSAWPTVLDVSADGAVSLPGRPEEMVRLPSGTRLGYRTSTDGTAYAVRLSDASDPSRYVDYDTNSGVVTPSAAAGRLSS